MKKMFVAIFLIFISFGVNATDLYYNCNYKTNNQRSLNLVIKGFYFAEITGVAKDKAEIEYGYNYGSIIDRASDIVVFSFPKSVPEVGPKTFNGFDGQRNEMRCTRYK